MYRRHWGSWPADFGNEGDAWRRFGRKMFLGFVVVFCLGALSFVAIGALLAVMLDSAGVAAVGGAVVVVAAIVLVVGYTLVRSIRQTWWPVRELVDTAASLADGDYSARVDVAQASRTIRPVATSFNEMARRLEEAEGQRRRLLADLGHELRTPLTVIRGEIEAMLDGVHQPDPEHLEQLLDEVTVMERLIEDLRTLSLAEAGALALHREPTDIASLLNDVADSYRRVAAGAGVALEVDVEEGMGDIDVDPVRIREVVTNLVVNALRAMPAGGVLTLWSRAEGDEIVLEVRDTGVGMAPDEVGRVFHRFEKGAASPGSGLGLTISRDLVTAHRGTIAIKSQPSRGTTVQIRLPR